MRRFFNLSTLKATQGAAHEGPRPYRRAKSSAAVIATMPLRRVGILLINRNYVLCLLILVAGLCVAEVSLLLGVVVMKAMIKKSLR